MSGIVFLGLGEKLKEWILDPLLNVIMRWVYGLYFGFIKAIAWVLDMLTQLFFIFAGMTPVSARNPSADNGEYESIDIVNYFLTQSSFQKAYVFLCGIALGLIIVFTIAKIIKQDYFDRSGPRSKGPIFRNVALSFIAFICIIPIFYFLVQAAGSLALLVMKAMGYRGGGIGTMLFNLSWADGGSSVRAVAEAIDGSGVPITTPPSFWDSVGDAASNTWNVIINKDLAPSKMYDPDNFGWFSVDTFYAYYWNPETASKYSGSGAAHISEFYWYVFIFTGLILIVNLAKMMIAMVTRMYNLIALFIISPSPISQIVLDDGARFKNWKDKVIQEALKVVGCVMSFMLFIMIASAVNDLDLMRYAFTSEAASAKSLIDSNSLTTELSNDVSLLYYYGDKISWVDSAINALGRAMILIAGVGAIQDIDQTITPFLYGGTSSMDGGHAGKAISAAAGAAAKGALDIGKKAIGGAASMVGHGIELGSNTIKSVVNNVQEGNAARLRDEGNQLDREESALNSATRPPEGENGDGAANPNPNAPTDGTPGGGNGGDGAPAPDTNTPETPSDDAAVDPNAPTDGTPGGENSDDDAAAPAPGADNEKDNASAANLPNTPAADRRNAEEKEKEKEEKRKKEEKEDKALHKLQKSSPVGRFFKGLGKGVGRTLLGTAKFAGKTGGKFALQTVGTAAKTGLSIASIAAKTLAKMTGMGAVYGGAEDFVKGTVGETTKAAKKTAKNIGRSWKRDVFDKHKENVKKDEENAAKAKNIQKMKDKAAATNSPAGGGGGSAVEEEISTAPLTNDGPAIMEETGVAGREAIDANEEAVALGNNSAEAQDLATPKMEEVYNAEQEVGRANSEYSAAKQDYDNAKDRLFGRKTAQTEVQRMSQVRDQLTTDVGDKKQAYEAVVASQGVDSEAAKAAKTELDEAQARYANSEEVRVMDEEDESARNAGFKDRNEQLDHLTREAQSDFDVKSAALNAAEQRVDAAKKTYSEATSKEATTAADRQYDAYQNYHAAHKEYMATVNGGGTEEQVAAARTKLETARDSLNESNNEVRRVTATVKVQNKAIRGATSASSATSPTREGASAGNDGNPPVTEVDVRIERQPAGGGNRTPRPVNNHLGSTIATASANGMRDLAGMTIIRSVDQGQVSAELGEAALMAFVDKDGQTYANGRTLDSAIGEVPDSLTGMLNEEQLAQAMQDVTTLPQDKGLQARGIDTLDKYHADLRSRYESASKGYEEAMSAARQHMNAYKSSGGTNTEALEAVKKAIAEAVTHSANLNSVRVEIKKDK